MCCVLTDELNTLSDHFSAPPLQGLQPGRHRSASLRIFTTIRSSVLSSSRRALPSTKSQGKTCWGALSLLTATGIAERAWTLVARLQCLGLRTNSAALVMIRTEEGTNRLRCLHLNKFGKLGRGSDRSYSACSPGRLKLFSAFSQHKISIIRSILISLHYFGYFDCPVASSGADWLRAWWPHQSVVATFQIVCLLVGP